ncbi:hypothetical protein ACFFVB_15560 [Formosa undariae]|uniref:SGNH/GDSL hydrolase family protein n=1 Tax=Formosa undariae TaxID=1325436 RepID=A0ABV5F4Z0_9FLAO
MKKFLKSIFIFAISVMCFSLLFIVPYINADPYFDFFKKNNYSWIYRFQMLGDLSTKKLIHSDSDYNSFIFGSSRTTGVYGCYLEQKIPDSEFYHFANWSESIGGIYKKIKLIDSLGYSLDNTIIYLDTDYTFEGDGKEHEYDHYLITGENRFSYLHNHFKTYYENFSLDKFDILLGNSISGENFPNRDSDPVTNDAYHRCNDITVIKNYAKVKKDIPYLKKMDSLIESGFMYKREAVQKQQIPQISTIEKKYLEKIAELFKKHNTNYYIVVTPLYDQYKFHKDDLTILNTIFPDRVFDFSGINSFTIDPYNFPDRKHFQPYISKKILDSIVR